MILPYYFRLFCPKHKMYVDGQLIWETIYNVMIEKSVAMPKTSAPVPAPLNTCLHNCLKKTLEQTTCQTSPWQHKCWVWLCFRSASGDVSGSVPSHPGSATSRPLPPPQLHSGWEQKFPLGPDCCSISVDWTVCCRSYQFPTAENLQDTPLGRCVLQDLAYLFLLMLLTILPSTPMITNLFISLKEPFIFYLFWFNEPQVGREFSVHNRTTEEQTPSCGWGWDP